MDIKNNYEELKVNLKPYVSKMELVLYKEDDPPFLKVLIAAKDDISEELKELGYTKVDDNYYVFDNNQILSLIGVTTKESWGAAFIHITSCTEFYTKLVSYAKNKGYDLTYSGLFKDGEKLPSAYEANIFRELGLYVPALIMRNIECPLSLYLPTTKYCDVTSSDNSKVYTIYKDHDQMACTCDGFMYRNTCSHINEDYIKEHKIPTKENPMKNTNELLIAINEILILLITRFKDGLDLKDFPAIWEKITTDEEFKELMRVAYEGVEEIPAECNNMTTEDALQMTILQLQYIPKIMAILKK